MCYFTALNFLEWKLVWKVEGTNNGGGLVTPIIVGGVGGGAMLLLLSLLYFINILPVVIMNVFYVS